MKQVAIPSACRSTECRAFSVAVPADVEANTLSGLFAALLDRLPVQGDWVAIGTHRLTVLEMKDRHVEQARIEVVAALSDDAGAAQAADSVADADQALEVPSSIPSGKAASNSPL